MHPSGLARPLSLRRTPSENVASEKEKEKEKEKENESHLSVAVARCRLRSVNERTSRHCVSRSGSNIVVLSGLPKLPIVTRADSSTSTISSCSVAGERRLSKTSTMLNLSNERAAPAEIHNKFGSSSTVRSRNSMHERRGLTVRMVQ